MIDIENELFNIIATDLRTKFANIKLYGELILTPTEFPCVCIEEADNYIFTKTSDSGELENHVNVMYEFNVYSNKASGKKTECKTIFKAIDSIMAKLGFVRQSLTPMNETTNIYRLVGRYTAIVSKDKTIYRR